MMPQSSPTHRSDADSGEAPAPIEPERLSLALQRGLERFGHGAFRTGQELAIRTLLQERRLLFVAPTGGGKSLVYQLPACVLRGTSVVVSPLIALMHDQVDSLDRRGIPATFLASTLGGEEIAQRMRSAAAGRYKLIYVAPERLNHPGFWSLLEGLHCPLIAIDEAHCISEWGHDFRPEYMQLGRLLQRQPQARVLACTATATPIVRDEILARLGLPPTTPQLINGFQRPNLVLRAQEVMSVAQARALVEAQLTEALAQEGSTARRGSAIVYAATRKSAEAEAERLESLGFGALAYHAGLSPARRGHVQETFMSGRAEVVVATNAFGMGIDRADVRAVVHLAPPGSIEAYYQEVGRAGRDGEPAYGLLLSSAKDVALRKRLLESETDGRVPDPAVVEHKWNLFLELLRWAEGGACRHSALLRYFGTDTPVEDCGKCDVCRELDRTEEDPERIREVVRKALSGVARVRGCFGVTTVAKLLRGDKDPRLERMGLDRVSTFGVLSDRPTPWVVSLLRRCVTAGFVTFSEGDRPVVQLTEEGREAMLGQRDIRLALPPTGGARRSSPAANRRSDSRVAVRLEGDPLFQALRAERLRLAAEHGVPPYVVASDRSLREMVRLRPDSAAQLLQVHGFGLARAERYGEPLLRVVADHPA